MSETNDATRGAGDEPETAATETTAPAPADTGAVTAPATDAPARPSREERRFAVLSAKLSAGEQERQRLAAEVESLRRQTQPATPPTPPAPEDIPRLVEDRVNAELQQRRQQDRVEAFHAEGNKAFPDWRERCDSLMQMGADAGLAALLVETPDGAKVAAALADDPGELEKIAGLKTERARAIALGRYAATLEAPGAVPARLVSKAPAPIRPITGGTARVDFDPSRATVDQLVAHYEREARTKRGLP